MIQITSMGNSLIFSDFNESPGPGTSVEFFKLVQIKWIKVFFNRIQDRMDFDIDDSKLKLKWRDYFRLFTEIREKIQLQIVLDRRASWHPITQGYEMTRKPVEEESPDVCVEPGIPDDHTDDDHSDVDQENDGDVVSRESSSHAESQSSQLESNIDEILLVKRPKEWDPTKQSPIFFGYSTYTTADQLKVNAAEREKVRNIEQRAIATARESRSSILDVMEKSVKHQESIRLKKIIDLQQKYEFSRQRREEELGRNKDELSALAFRMYKVILERLCILSDLICCLHRINGTTTTMQQKKLLKLK